MRRRKATVELFEELRREYEVGLGSVAGVARKFGVHRRLVREALGDAVPHERPPKERARPKIGPLAEYIDGILEADRRAPRKQRHTAHRIWVRITKERPEVTIVESTVRRYVRERKRGLGLRTYPEVFVPQQYAWVLSTRDPAGVSGRPRAGVSAPERGLPASEVRQPERSGEEDPARSSTRRDGTVRGVPLALGL